MLEAAKRAGIMNVVCMPYVRDPYYDYDAMWEAYELLRECVGAFSLSTGFEVNAVKFVQLGMEWAEGTVKILVHFPTAP